MKKYYWKNSLGFVFESTAENLNKILDLNNINTNDIIQLDDAYNSDLSCNYKIVTGEITRKTVSDLQAERDVKNFQVAKQKKLQVHQLHLDSIVMLINGFALWYDSAKRGDLINTMNANTDSGQEFMPLRITEDVCFVKDEAQRKRILTSEFLVKISEFKTLIIEAGIYAQDVKLREIEITNKIHYATTIEELEAINASEGYPAEFSKLLRFY